MWPNGAPICWVGSDMQSKVSKGPDIAVLEDHPLVAKIIREVVEACGPQLTIQIFGKLQEFEEQGGQPSAILTDLMLPDAEGLDTITRIRRVCPDASILVNTAVDSQSLLDALVKLEIPWVHKRAPSMELFNAVTGLLRSAGLIDREHDPLEKLQNRNSFQSEIIAPGADKPLTIKQVQVMECCAKGLSAKETARILGMSLDTVRAHMTDIFHRLNAKNVAQAVDLFNRAKREAQLRSTDVNG